MVEVTVPSVGESISEGVLARWAVADGEYVHKGDVLFELETDKATTEVPAPESGVVHHQVQEGDDVAVGAVVASIDPNGGSPKSSAAKKADEKKEKPAEAVPKEAPAAEEKPAAEREKTPVTSVARKIAEENKIDLSSVEGTGPGGRITREDVEAAIRDRDEKRGTKPEAKPAAAPPAAPAAEGDITRERMSTLRRRIAARLVEAQHTAAMLTTFNDVDMSAIMELRSQYKDAFKEKHGVGLGFLSFFAKAVVEGLRMFPRLNAMIDGNEIVTHHRYHIGIAVSTDKGLVVPVVRDVDRLSFAQIEAAVRDHATKARDGKIDLEDLQGGTFTITNGGVFGSLLSTPILNPPQSGILGMHRIEDRPVAVNGQVVVKPMMYIALSYDHRLVDGREAVSFLVRVKECLENPSRMLLDI